MESASGYYFDKSAKELTLEEACTLAGIIKSPTRYSPIKNPENCIARRNLVLREMERDGLISEGQKVSASLKPLSLKIKQKSGNKTNTYSQSALDEASKILGIPEKHIAISGYKIHTYLDEEKQNALNSSLENNKVENVCNAGIVIDNFSHGIVAYNANSNLKFFDVKRQPGSCIKPILVYAPALNENVISPSTQILDEEITIGDYKPVNVTKRFDGYMSVEDAVKNSVNIPAIKTMSYIGIETGKQYAEKMGLSFDEKDDNYTLALGGMSYGISLKTLTNAFSTFANAGTYSDAIHNGQKRSNCLFTSPARTNGFAC